MSCCWIGWDIALEACSLHLIDLELVSAFAGSLAEEGRPGDWSPWERAVIVTARSGYVAALSGDDRQVNTIGLALGQLLASRLTSFPIASGSFTPWEARIDRGIGMYLRPPSRLFLDVGLAPRVARALPIRLDLSQGMMGGGWIPARLIPDVQRVVDDRMERIVRRMGAAELDPLELMSIMIVALDRAATERRGIFEAMDVLLPDELSSWPPGAEVVVYDRKRVSPALRQRIELAQKEPRKPGLVTRLFRRQQMDSGSPTGPRRG